MSIFNFNDTSTFNTRISIDENTVDALRLVAGQFPGKVLFETRFMPEDQVLTHLIFENNIPIRVFTRSGREMDDLLRGTVDFYGKPIELLFAQSEEAARTCSIDHPEQQEFWERRPETAPIHFILQHNPVLLSSFRRDIPEGAPLRQDSVYNRYVFNPLIYWTDNQVFAYILDNGIPHAAGSVPSLNDNGAAFWTSVPGWSGSFRKYLPQYSLVSGSFNIVHQIVNFFKWPQFMSLHVSAGN